MKPRRRDVLVGVGAAAALAVLTVAVHRAGLWPGILGRPRALAVDLTVAWVAYAVGVALLLRLPRRPAVVLIVVGAVAVRLAALTPVAPTSDDLYRYSWDGRVFAAGIDPYRYPPVADELRLLRDDWLFFTPERCTELGRPPDDACTRINRPHVRTIYPPAAQVWFSGLESLRPEGARDRHFETAALAVDLLLVGLLLALLRRSDPRWAALYAFSPLAAHEVVSNAHVDGLSVLLAVAAVGLVRARAPALAAVPLALAVLVKLVPAVLVPLVWRSRPALAVLAGAVALAYVPHVLDVGIRVLGYLPGYLSEERYDDGGRFLLLPVPGPLAPVVAVVVLLALVVLVLRVGGPPEVVAVRLVGALLFVATPVQPWYAVLLVALAALARQWWWPAVGAAAIPVYLSAVLGGPTQLVGTVSYALAAGVVAGGLLLNGRRGAVANSRTPSANDTAAVNPSS